MPTIAPDDEPTDPTLRALDTYRRQMWIIHDLTRRLERLDDLPPHYKALAGAIVKLSGLRPHRIVGEGSPAEARAIVTDLEAIALAVDPLVEALGSYAASNFNGIDEHLFEGVLAAGLEGFGIADLESAADRKSDDLRRSRSTRYQHAPAVE